MKFYFSLIAFLFIHSSAFAEVSSSVSMFQYHPERIKVGTVYHYTKSNLDGTKPATVSICIKAADILEVYKAEEEVIDAAHIIAKMDWTSFSASELADEIKIVDVYRIMIDCCVVILILDPDLKRIVCF